MIGSIMTRRTQGGTRLSLPLSTIGNETEECKGLKSLNKIQQTVTFTEIYRNLYLGDEKSAHDKDLLFSNGITHIINCVGEDIPNIFENQGIKYFNLNMRDNETFSFLFQLTNAIQFIANVSLINPNSKILIHCQMGISRSPTIALGYLIWKEQMNVDAAMLYLKGKAANIEPNFGFLCQLTLWYNFLSNKKPNTCLYEDKGFFNFIQINQEEILNILQFHFGILVLEHVIIVFANTQAEIPPLSKYYFSLEELRIIGELMVQLLRAVNVYIPKKLVILTGNNPPIERIVTNPILPAPLQQQVMDELEYIIYIFLINQKL